VCQSARTGISILAASKLSAHRLRAVKVVAIHVAPASRLPVRSLDAVVAEAGKGLVGDRYHGTRHRHVTVQSQELLDHAADALGYHFDPGATRRAGSACRVLTSGTIRIGDEVAVQSEKIGA
jgi:MOSC domain-containing protein YiiM